MNVFASLGIIALAILIMASLQLTPGVFAIFYHHTLGAYSKNKASVLSLYFILGVEVISALLFLFAYYISNLFFLDNLHPEHGIFAWTLVGILIALSLAAMLFYYRPEHSTRLFIPRSMANAFNHRSRLVRSRSDAFTLGITSTLPELIFTVPLYFITAIEISEMNTIYPASDLLTIIYILASTIPLFIIRWRYQSGQHLAEIQRSRLKDKTFTRIILCFSYLTIAILIICFRTTS